MASKRKGMSLGTYPEDSAVAIKKDTPLRTYSAESPVAASKRKEVPLGTYPEDLAAEIKGRRCSA